MICCHRDGKSHIFTRNIFAFRGQPALGWQSSAFRGNWYGELAGLPEDPEAKNGSPIELEGLSQRLLESEECRRQLWDRLAEAAGTRAEPPTD